MSFESLKQLATGTAVIKIQGVEETVNLLTVGQREHYESLVNSGMGTVQANIGRGADSQKANMNIEKITKAQQKANHYLIANSLTKEDGTPITEDDIDGLYLIYPELVKELKRVNDIIESDDKTTQEILSQKTTNDIKKQ